MNTFVKLLLSTVLALSSSTSFCNQIMDLLHQKLEIRLVREQGGLKRINDKIRALGLDDSSRGWFEERAFLLKISLFALRSLDAVLEKALADPDAVRPHMDIAPGEVLEKTAGVNLSLPHGGAASGDGFGRACPADGFSMDSVESTGLLWPVAGVLSAGTWSYPSGSLHLGMDIAAGMFSPVRAPTDGVILYADAATGDGGGYLGNWVGWPYGGGNTISMIGMSDGQLYAISFFHLSTRLRVVSGQQVRQGDIIAYSGNSGNSTGPHTHVELFEIRVSFEEAVRYFQQTADFSFGCGWDRPRTCSSMACRIRPETHMETQGQE